MAHPAGHRLLENILLQVQEIDFYTLISSPCIFLQAFSNPGTQVCKL